MKPTKLIILMVITLASFTSSQDLTIKFSDGFSVRISKKSENFVAHYSCEYSTLKPGDGTMYLFNNEPKNIIIIAMTKDRMGEFLDEEFVEFFNLEPDQYSNYKPNKGKSFEFNAGINGKENILKFTSTELPEKNELQSSETITAASVEFRLLKIGSYSIPIDCPRSAKLVSAAINVYIRTFKNLPSQVPGVLTEEEKNDEKLLRAELCKQKDPNDYKLGVYSCVIPAEMNPSPCEDAVHNRPNIRRKFSKRKFK
jgi:hypothetical protein